MGCLTGALALVLLIISFAIVRDVNERLFMAFAFYVGARILWRLS